jgi:hypothetical protein
MKKKEFRERCASYVPALENKHGEIENENASV